MEVFSKTGWMMTFINQKKKINYRLIVEGLNTPLFLCLNSNMNDQKAAKIIIKRSKKNPILYSQAEILYAKRIKKLQKKIDD